MPKSGWGKHTGSTVVAVAAKGSNSMKKSNALIVNANQDSDTSVSGVMRFLWGQMVSLDQLLLVVSLNDDNNAINSIEKALEQNNRAIAVSLASFNENISSGPLEGFLQEHKTLLSSIYGQLSDISQEEEPPTLKKFVEIIGDKGTARPPSNASDKVDDERLLDLHSSVIQLYDNVARIVGTFGKILPELSKTKASAVLGAFHQHLHLTLYSSIAYTLEKYDKWVEWQRGVHTHIIAVSDFLVGELSEELPGSTSEEKLASPLKQIEKELELLGVFETPSIAKLNTKSKQRRDLFD